MLLISRVGLLASLVFLSVVAGCGSSGPENVRAGMSDADLDAEAAAYEAKMDAELED